MNDEPRGTCDKDIQIRFKTAMLRSSFCDYTDEYMLVKKTIVVRNTAAQGAAIMTPIIK